MFLFNANTALARSFVDGMGRSDSLGNSSSLPMIYLYEGPMPATLDDVPFDIQDFREASRNAITGMILYLDHLPNNTQKHIVEGDHRNNTMPIKRSVWDNRRSMYRLAPKLAARYDLSPEIKNEFPTFHEDKGYSRPDEIEYYPYGSGMLSNRNQYYRGDLTWMNDRRTNVDVGYYGLLYGNRYSYSNNTGVYHEFEQDVTVDAVEFWQFSNTSRTSYHVTFEYFDEVAGEWVAVRSQDDPAVNTTGFNQDKEFVWTLPAPVTAKKFIFSGDNTGNDAWYIREVSLLSNTEPYNNTTAAITWGLMYPGLINMYDGRFYEYYTDSYSEQGRWPVMMFDVGGPGSGDKIMTVNQAENLPGFFNVSCLNFNVEFEEPQV